MEKKNSIQTKIINTAQEVFTRFGYAKTTMEDIAREMGKGKSSIYYYFTSKEDIYRAVIEKELQVMKTKILNALSQQTLPREKLKAYVGERMHGLKSLPNLYQVLRVEILTQPDFIVEVRQQTDRAEITIVTDILDGGVADGTFNIEETHLTAIAIVTALKGMEIPLLLSDTGDDNLLEQRLDRLLDVLFFGIVKR
jgi:AcrR family transcriptional regulator